MDWEQEAIETMKALGANDFDLEAAVSHDLGNNGRRRSIQRSDVPRYSNTKNLEADFKFLGQVIGSGMSGNVRLAIEKGSGAKCAVKTLVKEGADCDRRECMRNEVEVHLCMDHPNVAMLKRVFESTGSYQLVTDFYEGASVSVRLRLRGRFEERPSAESMRQMLSAVSYLHANFIAHLDLKPDNFMYDKKKGDHVHLIDFGLATRWDELHPIFDKTCGSPVYMAPEVVDKAYTEKADLWSLGISAHELLTGVLPWPPNMSRQALMALVQRGELQFAANRFDPLSADARTFVRALLVKDASVRPSAVDAMELAWIVNMATPPTKVDGAIVERLAARLVHTYESEKPSWQAIEVAPPPATVPAWWREQFRVLSDKTQAVISATRVRAALRELSEQRGVQSPQTEDADDGLALPESLLQCQQLRLEESLAHLEGVAEKKGESFWSEQITYSEFLVVMAETKHEGDGTYSADVNAYDIGEAHVEEEEEDATPTPRHIGVNMNDINLMTRVTSGRSIAKSDLSIKTKSSGGYSGSTSGTQSRGPEMSRSGFTGRFKRTMSSISHLSASSGAKLNSCCPRCLRRLGPDTSPPARPASPQERGTSPGADQEPV